MSGIYIYKGTIKAQMFSPIKAMISFGEIPDGLCIPNTKHFSEDEARKGLEQLKRWVSTGAFKCVLLSGFISALKKGNTSHIKEWLSDHSSEPGFPVLILIDDEEANPISDICKVIEHEDELYRIINT